jgi:type I restriction enzyme M protein
MNQNNTDHRRTEVKKIVKNACDQLNTEGVGARNYVEQLAWLFFLKAFDEIETRKEREAAFDDTPYERRLAGEYTWSQWAKNTDHPDDMLEFVNGKLWIKLTNPDSDKGLGNDPLAQRFRRIFDNVHNHSRRGVGFAKVVQQVDKLHFSSETDVIVLSEIYEDLLKRVAADSAGYAGEFYTQRHIIRAMVKVIQPQAGERFYDPCFGTAGFLGEAAEYIRHHNTLSGLQLDELQHKSFYGLELKSLTYLLGAMNMILHGIEGANLELADTLELHNHNVAEKDKYQVILANPPYGGKMAQQLQTNFRVRSSATECLFLQHIMANLANGGRAAVIIPEGVLFRGGPDQKVRKELLEQFKVNTILSLPAGCFLPYTGVKTNVIFFDRPKDGTVTDSVWYYDLTNDGFELKQTRKPITGNQLPDFHAKQKDRVLSDKSWTVPVTEIVNNNYDLTPKNPTRKLGKKVLSALAYVQEIRSKEEHLFELLSELENMIEEPTQAETAKWEVSKLSQIATRIGGGTPSRKEPNYWNGKIPWFTVADIADVDNVQDLTTSREAITLLGLEKSSAKLIPAGSVVFSSRVVVGKVGVTKNDMATNQDFSSFTNLQEIDPYFLAFFLVKAKFDLRNHQRGATIKGVTTKVLDSLEVPLPEMSEQLRLVERIKEAMSLVGRIAELRNEGGEYADFRAAILRQAFAGEL